MTRLFRSMRWIAGRRPRTVGTFAFVLLLAVAVMPVAANATGRSPLAPFLLKAGEVGGFEPGNAQVFRSVGAVREGSGARPATPTIRRYEAEGLLEAAIVRIHDRAEAAAEGISSVFEFEAPAGAKAEMKAEKEALRNDLNPAGSEYVVLRQFRVPWVTSAAGFALLPNREALRLGAESGIAKGLSVEGSCLITVGILRPWSKEVIEPVRSGMQAISARTGSVCP